MKILFINNNAERCGVADYGRRLFDILKKSGMDITHAFNDLEYANYDLLLYNYHYATMPNVKKLPVKQVALFHEAHMNFEPDLIINVTELPRPLFENLILPEVINPVPVIGSFGFGFPDKNFPGLCELVKQQYSGAMDRVLGYTTAIIRLNIPFAEFGDKDGVLAKSEVEKCRNVLNGTGIKLEVNHSFLTQHELLVWLNYNYVNLFTYHYSKGRGLSSAIDYAASVNKPVGVSNSEMFRHLPKEVCIDNTLIKDLSIKPLFKFKQQNSNAALVHAIKEKAVNL